MTRKHPARAALIVVVIFAALIALAWVTDAIRPQGVRAIYAVGCAPGTWEGSRCHGRLVAGEQYRFQVVESRGEVLFWTAEAPAAVGKYSLCTITDRSNWSCNPNAQTQNTITHQMIHGHPIPDPNVPTPPFHEIQKWRWLLLRAGVPVGHDAL
jgi:hypothetical protein